MTCNFRKTACQKKHLALKRFKNVLVLISSLKNVEFMDKIVRNFLLKSYFLHIRGG